MSQKRVDFHGRLDGRTVLGDGSVRFTARLTRTGVFDYGGHKELRLADEVFAQEALDSFRGVVVTDGHKAWIDTTNWKTHAIGHVGDDVHQDGEYVVASVVIKDKVALEKIDKRELKEISMGYSVELEEAPGRTDAGEEYHAIQRSIRGNHAALGPESWGRAGGSVRLLDDGTSAPTRLADGADWSAYAPDTMTIDLQKNIDAANAERDAARKERDDARAERDAVTKKLDATEAERDALKASAEKLRADADPSKVDERVNARLALLDAARTILGSDYDAKGKSDREVRVAALQKVDEKVVLDGKSDDYVAARFDMAVELAKTERADLGAVHQNIVAPEPGTKSVLDEAEARVAKERAEQSKGGPPAGAMLRK